MDREMTQMFSFWQKLIYICFDQMSWFDKKVQYSYTAAMIEDMKLQDHLRCYEKKKLSFLD